MATRHLDIQNFVAGAQFNGLSANVSKAVLFDDFLGDVIEDGWSAAKGSDGQAIIATIQASTASGAVRLTSGDTVTVAESCSSLTHGLNWKAGNGGLVMQVKFTPVTSVANVAYFVGFTDTLATTTLEEPFTLSGTTFTSNATDAVGFVFDTAATTDVWYGIGVKADVDTAAVTCTAPVADTAYTLKIVVDETGVASFYINDVLQGSVAAAVTTTVALTPCVEVMARTTTSKAVDIDYVLVEQTR